MSEVYRTPLLEADASTGKPKFWQGFVCTDGKDFFTYSITKLGENGKEKQSAYTKVEGKNIGKANETSPKDQAILEIQADEAKKRKKGYGEEGQTDVLPEPMSCHPIEKVKGFAFPAYSQPKMDGVRCIWTGSQAYSRGREIFNPAFFEPFEFPTHGYHMDGELYVHGISFQKIQSAIESYLTNDLAPQIEYHLFDVVAPELTMIERLKLLDSFAGKLPPRVKIVETLYVSDMDRAKKAHEFWCERGFEGSILRETEGTYEHKRSRRVVKLKDFVDNEYLIVGHTTGKGKEADQIMFICQTTDGQTFNVTPNESIQTRRDWLKAPNAFIGRMYTVKHFGFYDSGIPRFPKGKAFRAKFDLAAR